MNGFHNYTLKQRFDKLNPGLGSDLIDWSITSEDAEYVENLETLREEYPEFRWDDEEDYDSYARDFLKEQASDMGLKFTSLRTTTPPRDASLDTFMNQVSEDVQQTLILFLSERGHGKSTSLKTIISFMKKQSPEIIFKAFDPSLSWFNCAPLKHRQYVTLDKITNKQVVNLEDCVYEIGDLPTEIRRGFIATLVSQDFNHARETVKQGETPRKIIYIIEEANTIFGSYSFRKQDGFTTILQDFVSIGRNMGLSAFLVSTAEVGELSPSLRRRSRRIYGRITSPGDIKEAQRKDKQLGEIIKTQPRFTFSYAGQTTLTTKIPDTVRQVPQDYTHKTQPTNTGSQFNTKWFLQFTIGAGTLLSLLLFFRII